MASSLRLTLKKSTSSPNAYRPWPLPSPNSASDSGPSKVLINFALRTSEMSAAGFLSLSPSLVHAPSTVSSMSFRDKVVKGG